MNLNFDQNLFTGSVWIVAHSPCWGQSSTAFKNPVNDKAGGGQAVFYVTVDKNSPAAHVNIDLASLRESDAMQKECCDGNIENHFTGRQGVCGVSTFPWDVGLRGACAPGGGRPQREGLQQSDAGRGRYFLGGHHPAGDILRSQFVGKKQAEVVSYPKIGKTAYRHHSAVRVQVGTFTH